MNYIIVVYGVPELCTLSLELIGGVGKGIKLVAVARNFSALDLLY